ncbi:MAG TPA: copper homeostasis protein CutC [Vicinamibacterales bacterium]|nr:copper homeostasis protein CutC [Vicinamibacterales bacterium]
MLLEICCGSLEDAIEAEAGGADRVELCSNLFWGGLTPSFGTIVEARRRLRIPAIVMIRARGGGFNYTEPEFAAMVADAEAAISQDMAGLVFGVLTADGAIDQARTRRLRDIAGSRDAVFHRAFDVTPDPFRAIDELVDLGITRVLTSGQQDTVPEGIELIAKLVEYAGDRIQVMPGGGIKPFNIDDVIRRTGCRQIHVAAWTSRIDDSTRHRPSVTFGGALLPPENRYDVTDRAVVKDLGSRIARK